MPANKIAAILVFVKLAVGAGNGVKTTPDFEASGTFVTALARGLAVMKAFTAERPAMTLSEVARAVDLSRATVRRCLLTLESLGYVEAKERSFSLSPQVLTLAQAYLASNAMPRIVLPFLERVSERLGESCSASILSRGEAIYVARSTRRRMASLHREVGTHLPAYCTSMGRMLLSQLPEAEQRALLGATPLHAFTPFTVTDPEALLAILARVRRDGFCIVDQELEIDLRSLAVPLMTAGGRTVAAIHISTLAGRVTRDQLTGNYLAVLRETAAEIRPLLVG